MSFPLLSLHIESENNSSVYLQHCSVPLPASILVSLALSSSCHQALYTRGELPWITLSLTYVQSSLKLLYFQFFLFSVQIIKAFFTSLLEVYRPTSTRNVDPLQWHHLLFLLSTLWCWSPASCTSHLLCALQPLASFPTKYLLHAATDTSFAACSSASCDVLTCWLIQVHKQVYPPVILILLLSAGKSHKTSPSAMAGAAVSQTRQSAVFLSQLLSKLRVTLLFFALSPFS